MDKIEKVTVRVRRGDPEILVILLSLSLMIPFFLTVTDPEDVTMTQTKTVYVYFAPHLQPELPAVLEVVYWTYMKTPSVLSLLHKTLENYLVGFEFIKTEVNVEGLTEIFHRF